MEKTIHEKIKDFSSLLTKILSDKSDKKNLFLEIYQNAITDRENAYDTLKTLLTIVGNKSSEHAIHGKSISMYIERMSKANDQLLKLTEILTKYDVPSGVNANELYNQLGKD